MSSEREWWARTVLCAVSCVLLLCGAAADAAQATTPPLYDNLGTLHHPISTDSELAQRYFDQGLRLVYAFNHEEAIRAFEEAAKHDPKAPMPHWGIALALGPNINAAMSKEDGRRAVEAIKQAKARLSAADAAERAYIEALTKRYLGSLRASRASLDKAYAEAMRVVWKAYPDDPDAGVLFAEAMMILRPWDFWTAEGAPKRGTQEIVSTLETVIEKHPDHPGACHYYIHAVEASREPQRALACADRLPGLMPGAGHLVHMPAHIYVRLGMYHQSSERNAEAAHADERYLSEAHLKGDYADGYYSHNLHFMWFSLLMEGRSAEALRAATALMGTITDEEAKSNRSKEPYLTTKLFTWIRFGRWEDLLREPPPPKGLRLVEGAWRLGRGMALVATGRLPGAEGERQALMTLTKQFRRSRNQQDKLERDLLKIAERLVAGQIASQRRRHDEAIKMLREATKIEDSLQGAEPPHWSLPIRHYLGPALLLAGRAQEAETEYRADLTWNPENGWGLFGLLQSLKVQRKDDEAAEISRRFEKAWAHADVTLAASRF
jgi:tetratricopeptide (TPR) repeat protein